MTSIRNIPFSPPDITEAEVNLVAEALRSGWITTGPKTKEFEKKIAEYCNTTTAVCLNSATACMEMALRVIGVGHGDEVIVPAYTYTATASSVCHVGATPVMVDCAPNSFAMDYDKLESAITERTKVIMPVDLAGIICDYQRIHSILEKKKHLFQANSTIQKAIGRCIILADSAHAFGAMQNGKKAGGLADFTSFSFHAVKNLTTAEGGALTWLPIAGIQDSDIYKELQLLSLHGQNKDALAKTKIGAWEYDIIGTYYKCNMTDVVAAIGLSQLERYPALLAKRRKIIEKYNSAFENLPIEVLNHYNNCNASSGHLYLVRLIGKNIEQRNKMITMMAERGVVCNVHYKPLPMMTAYKKLGWDITQFPNAYNMYHNEITLPLHTRLSDEDVEYVIEKFKEVLMLL